MKDLFDKRSAKKKLFDWAFTKDYIKTSDVILWGTKNFSNRSLRNMQTLAQEGKFRRLTEEEKIQTFGHIKEDVWRKEDSK